MLVDARRYSSARLLITIPRFHQFPGLPRFDVHYIKIPLPNESILALMLINSVRHGSASSPLSAMRLL